MQDAIGDYIESLANEAKRLRQAHGGVRRWWLNHDSNNCDVCGNKMVSVRISDRRQFHRRKRSA